MASRHAKGALTARERIDLPRNEGSLIEKARARGQQLLTAFQAAAAAPNAA